MTVYQPVSLFVVPVAFTCVDDLFGKHKNIAGYKA